MLKEKHPQALTYFYAKSQHFSRNFSFQLVTKREKIQDLTILALLFANEFDFEPFGKALL